VRNFRLIVLSLGLFGLATVASAQATRTWVSGVGDDANPCSRTAPCKTFAGAISKTANKGEISVLDPGGFGAVTITKSITINGDGTLGGILSSITNGVNVNDSATGTPNTIEVTLRSLSINGAGNGLNGVRFVSGKRLTIEHCSIANLDPTVNHHGVDVVTNNAGGAILQITDTDIVGTGGRGINISPAGGSVKVNLNGVHQSRSFADSGVFFNGNVKGTVSDSSFVDNQGAGLVMAGTADITLDHVRASGNNFGVLNNTGAPVTRLKDCVLTGNTTNGALNSAGTMTPFSSNVITNPSGLAASSPLL
jgi:parallel beta helix pectate lyase-like protein